MCLLSNDCTDIDYFNACKELQDKYGIPTKPYMTIHRNGKWKKTPGIGRGKEVVGEVVVDGHCRIPHHQAHRGVLQLRPDVNHLCQLVDVGTVHQFHLRQLLMAGHDGLLRCVEHEGMFVVAATHEGRCHDDCTYNNKVSCVV